MRKLTIIGIGLLGGSIGLAARKRKAAGEVVGLVRRQATRVAAEKRGAVDWATLDLSAAVRGADLIILCTPIGTMASLARRVAKYLKPGCIVTDVGSVKAPVVRALEPIIAKAGGKYVGSHPMAGSEESGVHAARTNLFEGKVCIVTPTAHTNHTAQKKVIEFWTMLGATVRTLPPHDHDVMAARVSHLPHVVASALVNVVCRDGKRTLRYAGPGFRDTTRVASSAPEMWAEICAVNHHEIGRTLDDLIQQLTMARRNLGRPALLKFLKRAKTFRDAFEL